MATLRDGGGTVQDVEFAPNHLGLRLVRSNGKQEKGGKETRRHEISDLTHEQSSNSIGNCVCRWPGEDLRGDGRHFLDTLGLGR